MSTLIVAGSPSGSSRCLRLAHALCARFAQAGLAPEVLDLRTLPAEALLHAQLDAPELRSALEQVQAARGIVFVTPVYKAAYSGLLKTFLDALPQFGLRDKVVLPLAVGGSAAHVLSIDYALRPVLSSLDPLHIVAGLFLLDQQLGADANGQLALEASVAQRLDLVIQAYARALARAGQEPLTAACP